VFKKPAINEFEDLYNGISYREDVLPVAPLEALKTVSLLNFKYDNNSQPCIQKY